MNLPQGTTKAVCHYFKRSALVTLILSIFIVSGCKKQPLPSLSDSLDESRSPVQVIETSPSKDAQNIELDTPIQVSFNTVIDTATINENTFIIREDTTLIIGSFSSSDSIISFTPSHKFDRSKVITTTLSSEIADTQGNRLSQEYVWNFTTRPLTEEERTPPSVATTEPQNGATDVALDTNILAQFSKELNPGTINSNTFYLQNNNGSIVSGSVNYDDATATFNPSDLLQGDTEYTATITIDIEDFWGNSPSQNYNWTFKTKKVDYTPPRIVSTNPQDGKNEVPYDIQIKAIFSEPVDPATVTTNTFRLRTNNGSVSGSVSYEDSTAVFNPSGSLQDGTVYTATITNGIRDLYGNAPGNNYNWNFTTKEIDRILPRIISTNPRDEEDEVPVDIQISATFSEEMDASTINENTFGFYLFRRGQYQQISGSVSYTKNTATFTPLNNLLNEQDYVVIISSDVADLAGNELGEVYRWDFETDDD